MRLRADQIPPPAPSLPSLQSAAGGTLAHQLFRASAARQAATDVRVAGRAGRAVATSKPGRRTRPRDGHALRDAGIHVRCGWPAATCRDTSWEPSAHARRSLDRSQPRVQTSKATRSCRTPWPQRRSRRSTDGSTGSRPTGGRSATGPCLHPGGHACWLAIPIAACAEPPRFG